MKSVGRKTGRPRGRPRSFDRDEALERAVHLFWKQGYDGTSINDLTSAMGITPPSLYGAFGHKERLFLEAVGKYERGPGRSASAQARVEPTARAAVHTMLRASAVEFTRPIHPPGCMVIGSALTSADAPPRLRAALRKRRAVAEAFFRSLLKRGIGTRELPESTDVRRLAGYFMTVLEGMTIQARDGATREKLLAVAEVAMLAWPSP